MTTFGTGPAASHDPTPPSSSSFRGDGPTPFLSQPRAQTALRHQLSAIEAGLAPELERRRADDPDSTFEIHVLPHRLIARLGDVGLSFSWVAAPGAQGLTVAEGRLLVIQWSGVASKGMSDMRGVAALRSALPVRERVYRPDCADAEHWRWRVDDDAPDAETCTTEALVAEWLATSTAPRPV